MAIIVTCLVLLVGGVAAFQYSNDALELAGLFGSTVGGLGLLVCAISFPMERLTTHGRIVEFESIRTSVEAARVNGESIENAALQVKIAESNQWLAGKQYWNQTTFDLWIPDAVDSLEPIR